jgi:hypothetical protein
MEGSLAFERNDHWIRSLLQQLLDLAFAKRSSKMNSSNSQMVWSVDIHVTFRAKKKL